MVNDMNKIEFIARSKNYTLIGITGSIPDDWDGKKVKIGDTLYKTAPVYDLDNHIAIEGGGVEVGQIVEFK